MSRTPLRPQLDSRSRWTWAALAVPLVLLFLGALTYDRSSWKSFMGDEATYLMQAESLAWDLDLTYTAHDYERFGDHWQRRPQGLILQSGDGGATIAYGKPFFYALYLAPFVRLAPLKGPFVANALLLAATCLLTAAALARRVGAAAPLWTAALIFASVTFAFTFWAHADLFLMCCSAVALALTLGSPPDEPSPGRWVMAGALLALVAFSRPLYLPLFLPVLLAVPRRRRLTAAAGLALAGLLVALGAGWVQRGLTGSWTPYGATRSAFYKHTGYPDVDFPRSEWSEKLHAQGNSAVLSAGKMLRSKRMTASLWGWNSAYLVVGRHVGLLPYFLPVLLAFAGRPRGAVGWGLLLAVAVSTAAFLFTRPFNFYGGGGTLANRYFLPLYPALWFLPTRPLRPLLAAAAVLLAGLFVVELWLHPRSYPITAAGQYRYVSPVAERLLPFETTQSHLKLAGREDLYEDFFVRLLSPELKAGGDGFIRLPGAQRGELLLASTTALAAVDLAVRAPDRVELEFRGGRAERLGDTQGEQRFRLHLDRPRARHPTWWTWERANHYRLALRFDGVGEQPVLFVLRTPS